MHRLVSSFLIFVVFSFALAQSPLEITNAMAHIFAEDVGGTVTECLFELDDYPFPSCFGMRSGAYNSRTYIELALKGYNDITLIGGWMEQDGNFARGFMLNGQLYLLFVADTSELPASVTPFNTIVWVVQQLD